MGSNLNEVFPTFNQQWENDQHYEMIRYDSEDSETEILEILKCPDCDNKGGVEASDDGNRDQICGCGKVLMKDGVKMF